MKAKDDKDEGAGSRIGALSQITQDLVKTALTGASDSDLLALLGTALTAADLDLSLIEIACDVVDSERALHFLRWPRSLDDTADGILATGVFRAMLEEEIMVLRPGAGGDLFAPILQDGATDAVAFASHLAPDATLGFFDDVMSLFATDRPGGFTAAEIELLHLVTPVFALALGARLNAAAARGLLQTYLGGNAATALLDGRVGLGDVEQIRAIVLYCDLFEFTALTERLGARALIDHLNLFFETMTDPVARAGGQVSGHVGDAVVMFFPVPDAAAERSLCTAAVQAALDGLQALERLNALPSRKASPPLRARVGIDIGDVVHGNIGSAGRFSFTIIGSPVNRAARLQALAKDLGATVLMTADLAAAAGTPCHAFGRHALRGFDRPVDIVGIPDGPAPEPEQSRAEPGSMAPPGGLPSPLSRGNPRPSAIDPGAERQCESET